MDRDFNGKIPVTFDREAASSQADEKRKRSAEASKRYKKKHRQRIHWLKTLKSFYLEEGGNLTDISSESPEQMSTKTLKAEICDLENELRDIYHRDLEKMGNLEEGMDLLPIRELRKKARPSRS